jgi:hypothetical protein
MNTIRQPIPASIVRQIEGGYFLDSQGTWWLISPSRGWVMADMNGRCFRFYASLAGVKL